MPVAHHRLNTRSSEGSQNLALPTINGDGGNHEKGVKFASETSMVMITRSENNARSAKRIIYRNIPPSIQNFTLSDMLEPNNTPRQGAKKKKIGQLSGNTPSDYAKRFFSRPTTQPKVVDFTTGDSSPELKRRGVNGFFPPVKLRVSHKGQNNSTNAEDVEHFDGEGQDVVLTAGTSQSAPLFLSRVFRSGSDSANMKAELAVRVQSADKVLNPIPKQTASDSDLHTLCELCKLSNSLRDVHHGSNVPMRTPERNAGELRKAEYMDKINEFKFKRNKTVPMKIDLGSCLAPGDLFSSVHVDSGSVSSASAYRSKYKGSAKVRSKYSEHPSPPDGSCVSNKTSISENKLPDIDNTNADQEVTTSKVFLTESKRTELHVTLCTAVDDVGDSETEERPESVNGDNKDMHDTMDDSNTQTTANVSCVNVQPNDTESDDIESNNKKDCLKIDASTQTKESIQIPTDTVDDVEQPPAPKGSAIKRHRKLAKLEIDSLKKRKHAYSAELQKRQLVFHEATIYTLVPTFRKEFTFSRTRYPVFGGLPPAPSRMQFAPTSYSDVRPRSSISRSSRASTLHMRRTPESIRTAPPTDNITIYPETFECGDLSYLPPPKRILPKREVPWVFRYKVKRNMNELSRIMASKPPQLVEA